MSNLKFNSEFLNEQVKKGNIIKNFLNGVEVLPNMENHTLSLKNRILYNLKKEGYKFSGLQHIGYIKNI